MLSYWLMPPRAVAASSPAEKPGVDARLGVPAPMQNGHTHGDLELNFVYGGSLRYFMGGRFVEIGPGTLSAFWAALPHQIVDVEARTEFMCARVPMVTLLRWNLGNAFLRKVLGGEIVTDPQSPSWDAEL